jgi:hypothetical protein
MEMSRLRSLSFPLVTSNFFFSAFYTSLLTFIFFLRVCQVLNILSSCLRNVVSLFHQIEKEMAWRKSQGRPEGFEMLKVIKPLGTNDCHF